MDKKQNLLCSFADQARDLIAAAEKTIWELLLTVLAQKESCTPPKQ